MDSRIIVSRSFLLLFPFSILLVGLAAAGSDRQQTVPNSVHVSSVQDASCDGDGNCWFATWGGVSVHTAVGGWISFTAANSPLAHDYTHDVAMEGESLVWIAHHYSGGMDLLDHGSTPADPTDDRWLNFPLAGNLPGGYAWVEDLYVDSAGRKWLGHGAGVTVLDDEGTPFDQRDDNWTTYSSANAPLAPGFVNAIVEDGAGCIWFGGEDGPLSRLCGDAWDTFSWDGVDNCLYCCWSWPGWVWELAVDDAGTLWMADGRCGAAWYDGANWSICDVHDPACGLPDSPPNGSDLGVRAVALDGANVWFGTRGWGAARRDSLGQWTEYLAQDTDWLGSDQIETIVFDSPGHGWFGTLDAGIFEYAPPATSSTTIGAAGGTLTAPDGVFSASFPAGAVAEATVVTYTRAATTATGMLVPIYSFTLEARRASDGAPVTHFTLPYTLTHSYAAGHGTASEESLAFYWWGNDQWNREASSTVDMAQSEVTATPDHMTLFAVLGESNFLYLPVVSR